MAASIADIYAWLRGFAALHEHSLPAHTQADVRSLALLLELKRRLGDHNDDVLAAPPRVDALWRAFVLHTRQYDEFTSDFCGGVQRLHYRPEGVYEGEAREDRYMCTYLLAKNVGGQEWFVPFIWPAPNGIAAPPAVTPVASPARTPAAPRRLKRARANVRSDGSSSASDDDEAVQDRSIVISVRVSEAEGLKGPFIIRLSDTISRLMDALDGYGVSDATHMLQLDTNGQTLAMHMCVRDYPIRMGSVINAVARA